MLNFYFVVSSDPTFLDFLKELDRDLSEILVEIRNYVEPLAERRKIWSDQDVDLGQEFQQAMLEAENNSNPSASFPSTPIHSSPIA